MSSSKETGEYRQSRITLISELSGIERRGQAFFNKCEKSVWNAYDSATAKADLDQLLAELQTLESFARESGLLSISGPSQDEPPRQRSLAERNKEISQTVDMFFKEKQRLLTNIRAAQ